MSNVLSNRLTQCTQTQTVENARSNHLRVEVELFLAKRLCLVELFKCGTISQRENTTNTPGLGLTH